jgi:hypothetical protein
MESKGKGGRTATSTQYKRLRSLPFFEPISASRHFSGLQRGLFSERDAPIDEILGHWCASITVWRRPLV